MASYTETPLKNSIADSSIIIFFDTALQISDNIRKIIIKVSSNRSFLLPRIKDFPISGFKFPIDFD